MNEVLISVLSTLLATNTPVAVSNWVSQKLGPSVAAAIDRTKDPIEQELSRIMELDDQRRGEVDDLLTEAAEKQAKHPELKPLSTREQMEAKLGPVRKAYQQFLEKHPDHARAHLAYGSFLNDCADEEGAEKEWSKAKQLDPKNPAAWNNLANYYGHRGPVTNAFVHYAQAIALDPTESTYYHNLATTMYLFRADAASYLHKSVLDVLFDSMAFYRKALELDPSNFILASDLAQSYYGFPKFNSGNDVQDARDQEKLTRDALQAWTNAFRIARDDMERQGVQIHFARLSINAHRFEEGQAALNSVTNEIFRNTKDALIKKLQRLQTEATNAPPVQSAPAPARPAKPDTN